jgi:hypothetical protein
VDSRDRLDYNGNVIDSIQHPFARTEPPNRGKPAKWALPGVEFETLLAVERENIQILGNSGEKP